MPIMTDLKPSTLELRQAGQSPWLDYISRQILTNGKLKSFIQDFGLLGVTSNPTIFEKAISDPHGGYEKDIQKLIRQNVTTFDIYDALTLADIRTTCDLFLPVFQKTKGEHGFVSLEVMPGLAHDTESTYAEAVRLFKAVAKPNVMIKVPATQKGLPAIRRLIGSGININITLMFSLQHYQQVARAYLDGLKDYQRSGGNLSQVHSVASVFVSRIDTLIDKKLSTKARPERLFGKAACANAKMIYQEFKKILSSEEFSFLKEKGANVQKVLWGSTSTKNPNYPDLLYVENLIGEETVNTMPLPTLEAFLDHGKVPGKTLEEGLSEAQDVIRELYQGGINLDEVGEELQQEGVKSFAESFDSLMRTLEKIRWNTSKGRKKPFGTLKAYLTQPQGIQARVSHFQKEDFQKRFFEKDPTLWKMDDQEQGKIANRLGWLDAIEWMLGKLYELDLLVKPIQKEGIRDIVLLGMGGSSLAPEVMSFVFKKTRPQYPRFHVLDTTDITSILRVEKQINLSKSLFIVASKSGTTVETVSQYRYFHEKTRRFLKRILKDNSHLEGEAGKRFVAITDSGSWLEKEAHEKKFRKVFINPSDIGGRFSALSYFGMVPAALLGLPVRNILGCAEVLLQNARIESGIEKNPAVFLGVLLGQLAKEGKDKLTFWMSPSLVSFSCWIEQLVAESTGKEGQGIVPIEGEPLLEPKDYEDDRVFVVMRLQGDKPVPFLSALKAIKKAGHPVIEIDWPNREALGAEFLRWEIATSITGTLLEINPFDEPNVQESKDNTARLLTDIERNKKLSFPKSSVPWDQFFSQLKEGGYIAFLVYADRSTEITKQLDQIRKQVAKRLKVPVLVGFGPRYLHSIGQLYKGGSRKGIFIELWSTPKPDLKIPEARYTFNQLKSAQALGDLQALESKGLPVLALDLGAKPVEALRRLETKLAFYFDIKEKRRVGRYKKKHS